MRRNTTLLLTSLACAVVAHAQASQTSGSIKGLVSSKKGDFIETGKVTARNLETGYTRTVNLEDLGYYSVPLLPIGPYRLTIVAPGMRTAEINVRVSLGQNSVINVDLEPVETTAVVEIVGQTSSLDKTQVNSFQAIDQQLVEAVPLRQRNFTDLVLLTPGAVDGGNGRVNVGGARGIMNNLAIDGASYNSSFFGEQRGSTRIPYTFGADTIRELQVITNAFDAQYGNAAGAIINAVTKSGTNDFSGSALAQFRPKSLVANVKPVPYDKNGTINTDKVLKRQADQFIWNVNVGGPIIKDKLHYYVGVEFFHRKEDFTPSFGVNTTTNSPANLATFLTNFGGIRVADNGGTLAQESGQSYTSDRKNSVYFGRLDWTINENHRATLRVNAQDLEWKNGTTDLDSSSAPIIGPTNQGLEKDSGLSWVLELNSVIGSNWVNEARIQRAIERRPRFANTTASPEFAVGSGLTVGQTNFLPNGLDEFTWQLIDNITWASGDWTMKGGVDLQNFDYANTFYRYQNGAYFFGSYAVANNWHNGAMAAGDTANYTGSFSDFGGQINFKGKLYATYIQGQYQGLWSHRLTLNGGVRWTHEMWDNNPRPNSAFVGLDQATSNAAVDPRFGFTFDLFGDQKTIVRGGWGVFSTPDPALTVSNTMNSNGNTTSTFVIRNAAGAANTFFNSGLLSYGQRVQGGTTLTPLPMDVLRNPGSYPGTGTLISAGRTGQVWDPTNKMPRKRLTALGLEKDLGSGFTAGVRGEYAEFEHLQYFVNINLAQRSGGSLASPVAAGAFYNDGYPLPYNFFSTAAASRPNRAIVRGRFLNLSGFGDVFLSRNDGQGDYKAIILTASRRVEQGWGFNASVTWSKAMDNNSNERTTAGGTADSNSNNPANPLSTIGSADSDRRFRGVLTAYFPLPLKVQGSFTTTYTTGAPYSAIVGSDLNGDGGNNDYVLGTSRNQFRQPAVKTFDVRLNRDFKIAGKFSLEGQIDIFNFFNWANQRTTTNTNQPSAGGFASDFGYLNVFDRNTREVQVGLRARF